MSKHRYVRPIGERIREKEKEVVQLKKREELTKLKQELKRKTKRK